MSLKHQMGLLFRSFLFLFLLFLFVPRASAIESGCNLLNIDEAEYLHQIWRAEDGLRSPMVKAILQSRSGYLWFCTDESFVRFDGVRFQEIEIKTTAERTDRWFTGLAEAHDGSIWASSLNGGVVRFQGDTLSHYDMSHGLLTNYVLSIFHDSKSNLWVGTALGLNRFENGRFISYTNEPGLVVEAVRAITEDSKGNLWIGTAKGLVAMRDGLFQTFTTDDLLIFDGVLSLFEDRQGRLWVGTTVGLTCLVDGRPMHYTTDEGLAHNTIRAIFQDRFGNIWIGSQGGLQKYNNGIFSIVRVADSTSVDFDGISFVYALNEDHEGNLWVGNNLGLNRLKIQKIKTLTKNDGLPHNLITSVLEDRDHNLWIATYGGGLSRLASGRITVFTTDHGLPNNHLLGLWQTKDGAIWVGSDQKGVTRIKDGVFTTYTDGNTKERPSENTVRAIFEDSEGTLWLGRNSGMVRLHNGQIIDSPLYPDGNIKKIIEARDGTLWIASTQGLTSLRKNQSVLYTRKNGLPSDLINTVFEDSEGYLWVATESGGIHRKTNQGFSPSPPSLTERILHITEDQSGNLWLSTRNGIFTLSKKQLNSFVSGEQASVEVVSYGRRDGMKRAQCNGIANPAGWNTHDGRIWFPTMYGLVVFDPKTIFNNDAPPPLLMQDISVDGKPFPVQSEFHLPPGEGQIEFHYAALSFQAMERVYYQYILEGFETNWVDAGSRRIARYTNLRPGQYRFRVKASNNDGVWNEAALTTTFSLAPHFYQTKGFYAACVLATVLFGMGINAIRIRQMQRRELQLSQLVEHRTAKLEEALRSMERFNYSIAHDLRAPLRAVRGFTQAICEDYNQAFDATGKEYCKRIEGSIERMDQLIDDLLTYGRLTHTEIHLGWVDSESVFRKVICDFQCIIQEKNARIDASLPLPKVWANSTLLEQIFSNLIGNALKFVSPNESPELKVWAESKPHGTRIYVKDNGIGVASEHQERIFRVFERLHRNEAYPGTGIGLAIVEKAAERMEGRVGVISELGKGSCFWIDLPRPQKNH
ncbi:MAG: hypothetical protein H0X66_10425 [Verrucomicrobia bacterium]|nr:hypothetical protein [Verrucomicrobiota bacterium]